MTLQSLEKIFREVFERPDLQIKAEDSPLSLDGWDSFKQALIIQKIEAEHHIEFELDDLLELKDVSGFLRAIENAQKR